MKHIFPIFLFLLTFNTLCSGCIGCLDNSRYLQERYDYKEYHPVACNCPCWQYRQLPDRGRCSVCKCFHQARPVYMIDRKDFYKQSAIATHTVRKKLAFKTTDNPFSALFDAYPFIGE